MSILFIKSQEQVLDCLHSHPNRVKPEERTAYCYKRDRKIPPAPAPRSETMVLRLQPHCRN